jgi:hypothetical protein
MFNISLCNRHPEPKFHPQNRATKFDSELHESEDWGAKGKLWFRKVSSLITYDMPGITVKNLMVSQKKA